MPSQPSLPPEPHSIFSRGPLLESCVDLEQRFWHVVTRTGEWTPGLDSLCFEEISYTMFTIAQVRESGKRGSNHGVGIGH